MINSILSMSSKKENKHKNPSHHTILFFHAFCVDRLGVVWLKMVRVLEMKGRISVIYESLVQRSWVLFHEWLSGFWWASLLHKDIKIFQNTKVKLIYLNLILLLLWWLQVPWFLMNNHHLKLLTTHMQTYFWMVHLP